MKLLQSVCLLALVMTPAARAQEGPKPGPEHEMLKKLEGNWDATMKFGGAESKGTMAYKMEVGGLWLVGTFNGDFAGSKFAGKGLDTYDAGKKKFVSIWVDSMSASALNMEGTYDKDKKTLTMTGQGLGMDGPATKFKSVSEMKDDDNILFSMYMGDTKEPSFTITYKRKK
ncbi:DUF1579 domain-containing protein [Limnoglobus roseus]|uniref:DUF1579 domain-containing protein n=1 Tax=Limnoglobus roseus TaxID=2598579 RepID=A0A5C1AEK1_9BACT|nr:DUF1579 domain-containing protein [Limnoglobus roseus]QEL15514.1 hypothetical protein PX52LOC_02438 [Limnoglobus roseus]